MGGFSGYVGLTRCHVNRRSQLKINMVYGTKRGRSPIVEPAVSVMHLHFANTFGFISSLIV
jgi:hypothetical protein